MRFSCDTGLEMLRDSCDRARELEDDEKQINLVKVSRHFVVNSALRSLMYDFQKVLGHKFIVELSWKEPRCEYRIGKF